MRLLVLTHAFPPSTHANATNSNVPFLRVIQASFTLPNCRRAQLPLNDLHGKLRGSAKLVDTKPHGQRQMHRVSEKKRPTIQIPAGNVKKL